MNKRAASISIVKAAKEAFQKNGYQKTMMENVFQETGLSLE